MRESSSVDEIIATSYAPLGIVPERFARFALNEPALHRPADYLLQDDLPDLMRHYQFPVQRWPFFVDSANFRAVEVPATVLPALINKIPRLFFDNDVDAICNYFGIENKLLFSMLFTHKWHGQSVVARGDFINTSDGLMCLEQNMGSQIGGWQTEAISAAYLRCPAMQRFMQETPFRYTPTNVLLAWFNYSIGLARRNTGLADGGVHNLFIAAPHEYATGSTSAYFAAVYQQALEQHGLHGTLFMNNFDALSAGRDGVHVQGQRIHSLLNPSGLTLPLPVLRAYMACTVYIVDETLPVVYSDKRMLALLSTHAGDPRRFTEQERGVIERHVPWTRAFDQEHVDYRGGRHQLATLAVEQQHEFVIKHAKGCQGNDLYIGGKTPASEWRQVVERAVREKCWVIQQYYASLTYLGQQGEQGIGRFHGIWGTFCFGERLGRIWLRIQPASGGSGIINSHQGAAETIAYVVDPLE
ncbi:hypothetical protein GJ700_09750 [Duganella sp. FT92W]|uniref:Glutathionylspermidine synthase pre-ATP-grasp-like domain-containing protein n=1 Tax=Pseudoduganella rivuli TaxID=2666085 RepID=A0A7X2ILD7_9BURK|nr:hypothetical protein [Pseudoduganella rivuli]MRV71995.1 hypothetical protein [Pseudoduganella rivuli]